MKKFNWKKRHLISALATVVFISLGVAKPEWVAGVVADGLCAEVGCDAT